MQTKLDASEDAFDESEKRFLQNVREYGWFGTHVFGDGGHPSFSYSTGIWKTVGFPELVVFSLKREIAHNLLWSIFNDVKAGKVPQSGQPVPAMLDGVDVVLQSVDKKYYLEHFGWSRWFYAGDDFPCFQLIWPDHANLFPWNTGRNEKFLAVQPDLTSGNWGRRN